MSESEVSDVYVRLGNDFNAAVAAFGQFNIDMRYVWGVGPSHNLHVLIMVAK
jgi:hypothetical protein